MKKNDIQLQSDMSNVTILHNEFIETPLLNIYEKFVFIGIKRHLNSKNKASFPSIERLGRYMGVTRNTVKKAIRGLEEKGIISIKQRHKKDGGSTSNLYVLHDNKKLWKAGTLDSMKEIASNMSDEEMIEYLVSKGYCITKEKAHTSEATQSTDVSAISNKHYNQLNNNTEIEKKQAAEERYSLENIRQLLCYDDMLIQEPYNQDLIDTFLFYLHDAVNSKKVTIRVNGEDKPRETVVSVLLKLDCFDFLYAVHKYQENTTKIENQKAYILTLLYNAKAQNKADVTNQVQHDMYCNA